MISSLTHQCSWWIDPFIIMQCTSLYLVITSCSEVYFVWYSQFYFLISICMEYLFLSFYFLTQLMSLYLEYISCRQHISWILFFIFIQSGYFIPYFGVFRPFTFNNWVLTGHFAFCFLFYVFCIVFPFSSLFQITEIFFSIPFYL